MNEQSFLFLANLENIQLILLFVFLFGGGIFVSLLIKIRYILLDKLIAVFNPFYWMGALLLKWFWREPPRYKQARRG